MDNKSNTKRNSKRRGNSNNTSKHKNYVKDKKYSKDSEYSKSDTREEANANLNINDPSWYFRDPVLKSGLTRMPTFEFLGTDIPNWIDFESPNISQSDEDTYMACEIKSPTLAVHYLNPSPGHCEGISSALNRASRMLYSKLSASNAKTSNYAPQDVSTLLLAIGELISGINDLTRAYGVTNYYTKLNRAIPSVFLRAYNITDEEAWISDLPNFRARLNKLIVNANAISFPANYPYFKKCAYIYQHIYKDNETDMTPYHMMRPYSTWIVDETSYSGGTVLKTQVVANLHPSKATAGPNPSYLTILEGILDAILTSITYNYIYADIINLFNRGILGSNLLSFATIPVDYWIEPVYSDQYNWQMMNEHIYDVPNGASLDSVSTPNNDVYPTPSDNCLRYEPIWLGEDSTNWWVSTGAHVDFHSPIIRVPGIGVSEDDLIECLAYAGVQGAAAYHRSSSSTGQMYIQSVSTSGRSTPDHYVTKVKVYYGSVDNTPLEIKSGLIGTVSNTQSLIPAICGEFTHFPLLHLYGTYATNSAGYRVPTDHRIYGQLKVYTTDMRSAISNIRFASLLGLFTPENF